MPVFFANNRGQVVRVGGRSTLGPSPLAIRLKGTDLGGQGGQNPNATAIVTQSKITAAGNTRIQHAADETIYAYTFGDRIGELQISGVCFARACFNREPGKSQVLRIYRENRVAASARSVLLSIGTDVFRALLVGMTLEVADPETELAQWGMRFMGLTGVPGRT
jgi:hypothetical protein